jgi:hypothetical protein
MKTNKGGVPPPIDPDNVKEVAADEIISIEVGGGFATLVLGKRRLIEVPEQAPRIERRVVSRLVLSHAAMDDMLQKLMAMKAAAQQAAAQQPHAFAVKTPDIFKN